MVDCVDNMVIIMCDNTVATYVNGSCGRNFTKYGSEVEVQLAK